MVTRMYAEHYYKDSDCAITQEEFEKVAVLADELTSKCKWDKIYLLCPHGAFVDDHERYMAHSGMQERQELFDILCKNIKASGNWNKVTVLDGGYNVSAAKRIYKTIGASLSTVGYRHFYHLGRRKLFGYRIGNYLGCFACAYRSFE
jgi:hypothetical protein